MGGNRQRQTGYIFLKKILEKGSNTPDQEIGPLNFENVIAHLVGHTVEMDVLSPIISVLCHSGAKLQATNRVPRPVDRGTATRYGG